MGEQELIAPPERGSRAALMLVLTTLVWGISFPWTKDWQNSAAECPGGALLAGLTLIGLRLPLAALVLILWQPRLFIRTTRREHGIGALIGGVFYFGFVLQVWGAAWTSPALSAFFTSLCSAWVPLLGWVGLRLRVTPLTLLGLAVALAGTAVLVDGWQLGFGERLTFGAAMVFAVQILLIDRLGRRVRSADLTVSFLSVAGLLGGICTLIVAASGSGLTAWFDWLSGLLRQPSVLVNVACLILLPGVLGFHWMNSYQPQLSANRAALIYLLEPVFAAIISVSWGYEPLTTHLLFGGMLILVGNLLVELPGWLRAPT
jgi:drug/metabolite transporter (DMT)-like permease